MVEERREKSRRDNFDRRNGGNSEHPDPERRETENRRLGIERREKDE